MHTKQKIIYIVQKTNIILKTKILFGQLNCSVKHADVSTRCSSHPRGNSEARCEKVVLLYRRGYCAHAHAAGCRGRSAGTID